MKIQISNKENAVIRQDMIGLFFEDINYAADGGLYAEMIENRSFEFVDAYGDRQDYYVRYDGGYAWSSYPSENCAKLQTVMGSPLTLENPHYMRVHTTQPMSGLANQGYDGMCLKQGMEYHLTFWARCVRFEGEFQAWIEKDGRKVTTTAGGSAADGTNESSNFYKKYTMTFKALETVEHAEFVLVLKEAGIVELDYISLFPEDAVEGNFRKDLFDKLKELQPGFIRFPGGCIVEGNTLANRYHYKDSLKENWARKNNWNRWAVHNNNEENHYHSRYSHYNQTMGLGYYEYFLLCELLHAAPLPVLNVGFACQYQSEEMVAIESEEFQQYLQDAVDLIEFANGDVDTRWGRVRAKMGHKEPFHLTMVGVGNEQWETKRADFFQRYELFEQAIHAYDPKIRLIGSAGPDITSERYTKAWEFYEKHKEDKNFVYAVDEHYYVKPEWFLKHNDFYDTYQREIKVFSGEYAAHPVSGMNRADANTLEGALAEAAFLTGIERNADVVVLASYAPLFARIGYAQWSPDMIWFDGSRSYATPSYYVQQMYSHNLGEVTLDTRGQEKEAIESGLFYSLSKKKTTDTVYLKLVNPTAQKIEVSFELEEEWKNKETYHAVVLSGNEPDSYNSINEPEKIIPCERTGKISDGFMIPPYTFAVIRM